METCLYCGEVLLFSFMTAYHCSCCGKTMCSNCITPVNYNSYVCDLLEYAEDDFSRPKKALLKLGKRYMCKSCARSYSNKAEKMCNAINNHDDVETFPKTYKGYKVNRLLKVKKISTPSYRNRNEATEDVVIIAKYLGCPYVIDLEWQRKECYEQGPKGGIHIYYEWYALGYAAKPK